ncbi:MAG: Hsp70 family protein [Muribaculaceae bacterium]
MATIGIDFGSSYTTVAWLNPATGCAEAVCFNGDGSVKMPSTILHSNGGLILGYQAQSYIEEVYKLPEETKFAILSDFIPSLKRILDPNAKEYIGDKVYTHEQLLEEFFRYVIDQAKDHCGADYAVTDVSFSYPVDFEPSKISLIRNAFTRLGLTVKSENIEPIAAVTGFLRNHTLKPQESILVFDFGGGTIDVACVRNNGADIQLVCEPKGSHTCGGQDVDLLIYNDLQKKIKAQTGIEISINGVVDYAILNSCRRMKELFSGKNDLYEIAIPLVSNGRFQNFKYALTRDAFENIIYPKVYEAVTVANQVQKEAKSGGYDISRILLIGGSSKILLVTKLLSDIFPSASIETCGEKDIAVALGNLLLCETPAPSPSPEKKAVPAPEPDVKIDRGRSIVCKNPSCGSSNCYKLVDEPGYLCLDCGWKGKNIVLRF